MAKVALVNIYEPNYLGTRLLASWLRLNKHETHNFLFKEMRWEERPLPEETHLGYQFVQNVRLLRSGYDVNPFTEREVGLLEEALAGYMPNIVGFSARSANNAHLPRLVPALRRGAPNALLVAGGYGPTLDPEIYLNAGFDVVVRGDGEEALLELADHHAEPTFLHSLCNTSWKNATGYIHNPLRPQEKNIDRYPPPLYGDEYFSFIEKDSLQHIDYTKQSGIYCTFFGRGCTGRCTYCSGGQWTSQYKGNGFPVYRRRNRAVKTVIKELCEIAKKKYNYVYILDEYFALDTKKTRLFFSEYRKYIGLPFFCFFNYEKMLENKDIFELVMDSGLDSTGIGIQCGDEDFARKYYNRKITNNIYLEYAKILFENNVYVGPNFIGGNCYEDEDIFMQTLALIKKIPFSITDPSKNFIANVQLKIHPHTPIASIAPKVVTDPMPAREWFYRAMLMESRRILDDEEFAECRTNKAFRDDPSAFRTFYHAELLKKQRVYFATLLDELKNGGKVSNVVFYGAGDLYKYNQTTFSPLSPAALLVDREYLAAMPSELNGLPVVAMEDFMRDKPDVTVIIFSRLATRMQRKLVRKWGMRNENIHTCTSILDLPQ